MKPDFHAAQETKNAARQVLEAAGIKARYVVTVTDQGPVVNIHVSVKHYDQARQALPFTIGSATVIFHKDTR